METLLLVRHAHAASNAGELVSGVPPGEGLSDLGRSQAHALATALAAEPVDLGVVTEFRRAQETLALAERDVPVVVVSGLNEIRFGAFEGGPLADYRAWAWTHGPDETCPGGGESRAEAAARIASALRLLLDRRERIVLAVGHAVPIRYVLDAAAGRSPSSRVAHVAHAQAHRLERSAVETAATILHDWALAPRFADTPFGG